MKKKIILLSSIVAVAVSLWGCSARNAYSIKNVGGNVETSGEDLLDETTTEIESTTVVQTEADTTTEEVTTVATTTAAPTTAAPTTAAPTTAVPTTAAPTTAAPTTAAPTTAAPTTAAPTTAAPTTAVPTTAATSVEMVNYSKNLYAQNKAYIDEVFRLTNEIRASVGVAPLILDETMCIMACHRSAEMDLNDYFEHTRPDGSSCFTIFDEYNVDWMTIAENIAWGYITPEEVVDGWKNSSGHYKNMTNPELKKIGIGFSNTTSGNYWTQIFLG